MATRPMQRVLVKEGDGSQGAFIAKGGAIGISGTHLPRFELEVDELLLGVVELFLMPGGAPPPRLFTVEVSAEVQISQVSFDEVLKLASGYEYGINANRFLAMVLEKTNELVRTMFRLMPEQWRTFQDRAILFYDLVNRWEGIAKTSGVTEYQASVDESKRTDLFAVGARFRQERSVSCIAFGSGWLSAAQRFPREQAICRSGDAADCMYILLEGTVHVAKPNQLFATINQPGECFGELAFFLKGKRTADLIAAANAAILRLDTASLPEFHATHPDMFLKIAGTLARRIQANLGILQRHHATNPEQAASEAETLDENARTTIEGFLEKLRRFLRIASNFEISDLVAYAQDEIGKL